MGKPPRNRRRHRGGGGEFGRPRTPPPPETGLEAGFWAEKISEKAPIVFNLEGGASLRGIVREFDHELIWVQPEDGPQVIVRKQDIRYLEEG